MIKYRNVHICPFMKDIYLFQERKNVFHARFLKQHSDKHSGWITKSNWIIQVTLSMPWLDKSLVPDLPMVGETVTYHEWCPRVTPLDKSMFVWWLDCEITCFIERKDTCPDCVTLFKGLSWFETMVHCKDFECLDKNGWGLELLRLNQLSGISNCSPH